MLQDYSGMIWIAPEAVFVGALDYSRLIPTGPVPGSGAAAWIALRETGACALQSMRKANRSV